MAITKKNRSLKNKTKGLKRKSDKSRKNSKKSQKVNKRKIRGGLFEKKLSQDDFHKITQNIEDSNESTSDKVDAYINAKEHITACGTNKDCEIDKYVAYGHRTLLGRSLQESDDYNDVSGDKKEALEKQINVWGEKYKEKRRKSITLGEEKNEL